MLVLCRMPQRCYCLPRHIITGVQVSRCVNKVSTDNVSFEYALSGRLVPTLLEIRQSPTLRRVMAFPFKGSCPECRVSSGVAGFCSLLYLCEFVHYKCQKRCPVMPGIALRHILKVYVVIPTIHWFCTETSLNGVIEAEDADIASWNSFGEV